MAGSWNHIITDDGALISNEDFPDMIENLGDAYEACEECYGMVLFLSNGDPAKIEEARERYREGLELGAGGSG